MMGEEQEKFRRIAKDWDILSGDHLKYLRFFLRYWVKGHLYVLGRFSRGYQLNFWIQHKHRDNLDVHVPQC